MWHNIVIFCCAGSSMLVFQHPPRKIRTSLRCKIICRVIFTIQLLHSRSQVSGDYYTLLATAQLKYPCGRVDGWLYLGNQSPQSSLYLHPNMAPSTAVQRPVLEITLTSITSARLCGAFYAVNTDVVHQKTPCRQLSSSTCLSVTRS